MYYPIYYYRLRQGVKFMSGKIMVLSNQALENAEISFAESGVVALQGMLIVFSVLIILMVVLNVMKLFGKEEPKKALEAGVVSAPTAVNEINKEETVAVISSAVAAMSGDDPNKRLRVVSVTDSATGECIWKK